MDGCDGCMDVIVVYGCDELDGYDRRISWMWRKKCMECDLLPRSELCRILWSLIIDGISQANLNKIQRIQNTLARVVTNTSKFEHITTILKKLHWLPIKQRIDYKLCLLTYKTLQIQQPTYLYNSLSFPSHSLSTRSSDSSVLSIPYVRTSLGKRAFSVIAPRLWNFLPPDTRNSLSVSIHSAQNSKPIFSS